MSISTYKRATGCYWLLKHGFDIDGAVEYVVTELADEPAMQRAKDPRKLARNIVTIGGSGDQQELNLQAFKEALRWFDEERHRNLVNDHKQEIATLEDKLRAAEERARSLDRDYRQMVQRVLPEGTQSSERETAEPERETEPAVA